MTRPLFSIMSRNSVCATGALVAALAVAALPSGAVAQNSPSPAPSRATVAESPLAYLVRRGDNLSNLARDFLRERADYRQLQRDNNIRNPRRIPTGSTININPELLRTRSDPAQLQSYRGDVQVIRGTQALRLEVGTTLNEGDVIATGSGAFARLSFSDGSHTVIPSNSRIRLDRLRRFVINNEPDHRVVVEQGRVESRVNRRQSPGTFRVITPTSVSAVRGTEFRVAYDPQLQTAATGVLTGQVAVANADSDDGYLFGSGFGGISTAENTEVRPVTLLTAPVMGEGSSLQTRKTLTFDFTAPENTRIVRGWIGNEAGMLDPVAEMDARAPSSQLVLDDLPEGQWFLRLTAIGEEGVEGRARTFSFIRALNAIEGLTQTSSILNDVPTYRFGWRAVGEGEATFRFQLSRSDENGVTQGAPLIDTPGLTSTDYTLTSLPAGTYSWRVEGVRHRFGQRLSVWSEPEILTITR